MGECIMEILGMAMDFFIAFVFLTIVIVCGYGSILFVMDEQAEWESRRDYDAMKEELEKGKKNDTSRKNDT
tara:strand:+ start:431 stop:643 length:213 start_codon:yes stop_codon:yes gene_type:complete